MEETFLRFLTESAAGAVGSIVALFYEEKISFKRALMLVFVGMALSGFLAPALAHYFGTSDRMTLAINFLMARYADGIMLAGKKAVEKIIDKVVNKIID